MRFAALSMIMIISGAAMLTACSGPSPMAGGYNNHAYYKSVSGPDANDLGYNYTPSANDAVLKDFERAAADLILVMEQQNGGLPADLKFLQSTSHNVIVRTMDYALRQELIVRGYNVYDVKASNLPEFSFFLDRPRDKGEEQIPAGKKLFFVTLNLDDGAGAISQVGDPYVLPAYDDWRG
jgi:hypothetical protein